MKIKKSQLRRIIKEEQARLSEARSRKLYPDDMEVGKSYKVGYKGRMSPSHEWVATFQGWETETDGPRMNWVDVDERATKWQAYMFQGKMSIGSSADPLIIHGEAEAPAQ
jgi:hypothetical protein